MEVTVILIIVKSINDDLTNIMSNKTCCFVAFGVESIKGMSVTNMSPEPTAATHVGTVGLASV